MNAYNCLLLAIINLYLVNMSVSQMTTTDSMDSMTTATMMTTDDDFGSGSEDSVEFLMSSTMAMDLTSTDSFDETDLDSDSLDSLEDLDLSSDGGSDDSDETEDEESAGEDASLESTESPSSLESTMLSTAESSEESEESENSNSNSDSGDLLFSTTENTNDSSESGSNGSGDSGANPNLPGNGMPESDSSNDTSDEDDEEQSSDSESDDGVAPQANDDNSESIDVDSNADTDLDTEVDTDTDTDSSETMSSTATLDTTESDESESSESDDSDTEIADLDGTQMSNRAGRSSSCGRLAQSCCSGSPPCSASLVCDVDDNGEQLICRMPDLGAPLTNAHVDVFGGESATKADNSWIAVSVACLVGVFLAMSMLGAFWFFCTRKDGRHSFSYGIAVKDLEDDDEDSYEIGITAPGADENNYSDETSDGESTSSFNEGDEAVTLNIIDRV